ncbi:hypothetical protein EIP86_011088, partial [Pleurotus ostreatoroseus]
MAADSSTGSESERESGRPLLVFEIFGVGELGDAIFDMCTAMSLMRLARVNRFMNSLVRQYMQSAFSYNRLLAPYFPEVDLFREVQRITGMLISGSTALQLFMRMSFSPLDLDVYVNREKRFEVGTFLLDAGYLFLPNMWQPWNFFRAASDDRIDQTTGQYGRMYGVAAVFTFVNRRSRKRVQVITTTDSPMAVIMMYHSTCVLNVISYNMAYCLYPRATLEDHYSVPLRDDEGMDDAVLDKYRSRGFSFRRIPRAADKAFGATTVRGLGDKYCWRIPLDRTTTTSQNLTSYTLATTTWHLQRIGGNPQSEHIVHKMRFDVVRGPAFRHTHIIGDRNLRTACDLLKAVHAILPAKQQY